MINILIKFNIKLIKFYKYLLSPLLGNNCRYIQNCSVFFKNRQIMKKKNKKKLYTMVSSVFGQKNFKMLIKKKQDRQLCRVDR